MRTHCDSIQILFIALRDKLFMSIWNDQSDSTIIKAICYRLCSCVIIVQTKGFYDVVGSVENDRQYNEQEKKKDGSSISKLKLANIK